MHMLVSFSQSLLRDVHQTIEAGFEAQLQLQEEADSGARYPRAAVDKMQKDHKAALEREYPNYTAHGLLMHLSFGDMDQLADRVLNSGEGSRTHFGWRDLRDEMAPRGVASQPTAPLSPEAGCVRACVSMLTATASSRCCLLLSADVHVAIGDGLRFGAVVRCFPMGCQFVFPIYIYLVVLRPKQRAI